MSTYDEILDATPGHEPVAAGHLHEEIWVDLLRRETPDLHDVRVTRGDGGIDGIAWLDPLLNHAHIYQAKFFRDLDEKHRQEVLKSFVSAHSHPYRCARWTLLVPFELSANELSWLRVSLRAEAENALPTKSKEMKTCVIDYKDSRDLSDLLQRHLDVAAQHLPASVGALQAQLDQAEKRTSYLEREVANRMADIQDGLIRDRAVQSRRAIVAVKVLNQGWANAKGDLQGLIGLNRVQPRTVRDVGGVLEGLAERRLREAYEVEGMIPGIAHDVGAIHMQARRLVGLASLLELGATTVEDVTEVISVAIKQILDLQQRIGAQHALMITGG